ncbi:MAG: hypothetical protein IJ902_06660 [Prevotella sp.]|nr:hypothetical protein [Prevotella sp.]
MDIVVIWATIMSPIFAVLLAWWTTRSSSRDVKKIIVAMKELEQMQINLLQLQLDKEISDIQLRYNISSKKENQSHEFNQSFNQIGGFADSMRHIEERQQDLASEREYNTNRLKLLQYAQSKLVEIEKVVK